MSWALDRRPRLLATVLGLLAATGCQPEAPRPASDTRPGASPGPVAGGGEDHSAVLAEIEELRRGGRYVEGLTRVRQALELSPNAALLHFHPDAVQGMLGIGLLDHATRQADAVGIRRNLERVILAAAAPDQAGNQKDRNHKR